MYQLKYHAAPQTQLVQNSANYLPSQTCISCPNAISPFWNLVISTTFCATTQSWFKSWFLAMATQSTYLPPISSQQDRENGLYKELGIILCSYSEPLHVPHWHIEQHPNPELVILSLHFPVLPSVIPNIKLCAFCVALICYTLPDVYTYRSLLECLLFPPCLVNSSLSLAI